MPLVVARNHCSFPGVRAGAPRARGAEGTVKPLFGSWLLRVGLDAGAGPFALASLGTWLRASLDSRRTLWGLIASRQHHWPLWPGVLLAFYFCALQNSTSRFSLIECPPSLPHPIKTQPAIKTPNAITPPPTRFGRATPPGPVHSSNRFHFAGPLPACEEFQPLASPAQHWGRQNIKILTPSISSAARVFCGALQRDARPAQPDIPALPSLPRWVPRSNRSRTPRASVP